MVKNEFNSTAESGTEFILHRGVVEDNKDPLKNGRVRVRIFGVHTEKNEHSGDSFEHIKTSHLPWAEVMGSTAFGLIGGIGVSSVLRQGTWVWVIFENEDQNKPIVIGTISGVSAGSPAGKYSGGSGFHDPAGKHPFAARSKEADFNRLARNDKLSDKSYDSGTSINGSTSTAHAQINATKDTVSATDVISGLSVSQTEPSSTSSAAKYPDAQVIETQSGHVIEIDDTSGNERVRIYHRSGSYIEFKSDGTVVQKSVGTAAPNHYILMSDLHEHIAKGVKSYIEQNFEQIINQNFLQNVKGNMKLHVEGNLDWVVGGNINIQSGGTHTVQNGGDHSVTAPNIKHNGG